MQHRYILQPYSGKASRTVCPECGLKNVFALYIDSATTKPIHSSVGRCNREDSCGFHLTPKQYFESNPTAKDSTEWTPPPPKPKPLPSFIDTSLFESSLKDYERNNFATFLSTLFGKNNAVEVLNLYKVGTSKHFKGGCVFWQVDENNRIRTGKIMGYNPDTGKRIKEPFPQITWVHSVLKIQDFSLSQCFFGEHLLIDKTKPVALVESEKSAIIAAHYFPVFIWLATSGKNGCKWTDKEVFKVLIGRTVTLFPDLGAFDKWREYAQILTKAGIKIKISNILELYASDTERQQGFDIADYLIQLNQPTEQSKTDFGKVQDAENKKINKGGQNPPLATKDEIKELIEWGRNYEPTANEIVLYKYFTVKTKGFAEIQIKEILLGEKNPKFDSAVQYLKRYKTLVNNE